MLLIAQLMWAVLLLYWLAASFSQKPTKKQEGAGRRIYQAFFALAAVLMVIRRLPFPFLDHLVFPRPYGWRIAGLLLNALGIGYALWARTLLGRNWSGRITIKEEHSLITRGPYRITRHPIYAGILWGIFGYALLEGTWNACLVVLLLLVGLLIKIHQEEQFLQEAFGEQYHRYARRVKRLVPFLW